MTSFQRFESTQPASKEWMIQESSDIGNQSPDVQEVSRAGATPEFQHEPEKNFNNNIEHQIAILKQKQFVQSNLGQMMESDSEIVTPTEGNNSIE